ncbi:MAG: hypothetical protein JST75_17125 [Bacteroidetes bacterium]|nr:hypothetical protein [Bacteroidota bacterium]
MEKKVNTAFTVTPSLLEEAKKYCRENKFSFSRQLEILLEKWIDEERVKRTGVGLTSHKLSASTAKKSPTQIKAFEVQFEKLKTQLMKLEKGFKEERKKLNKVK